LAFRPRFINEWFMALGYWEPYVLGLFRLLPGDVFIDIGAHIGYFSRLAAQKVGPSGGVLAMEADPRNVPTLRLNALDYPWVSVVPAACGQAEGTTRLLQIGNPLWSEVNEQDPRSVEVSATTLDASVRLLPRALLQGKRKYFMKIDIEKAELDALRGGKWFIETFRPEIILEAFPENAPKLSAVLPNYDVTKVALSYFYLTPKRPQ